MHACRLHLDVIMSAVAPKPSSVRPWPIPKRHHHPELPTGRSPEDRHVPREFSEQRHRSVGIAWLERLGDDLLDRTPSGHCSMQCLKRFGRWHIDGRCHRTGLHRVDRRAIVDRRLVVRLERRPAPGCRRRNDPSSPVPKNCSTPSWREPTCGPGQRHPVPRTTGCPCRRISTDVQPAARNNPWRDRRTGGRGHRHSRSGAAAALAIMPAAATIPAMTPVFPWPPASLSLSLFDTTLSSDQPILVEATLASIDADVAANALVVSIAVSPSGADVTVAVSVRLAVSLSPSWIVTLNISSASWSVVFGVMKPTLVILMPLVLVSDENSSGTLLPPDPPRSRLSSMPDPDTPSGLLRPGRR